MITTNKIIKKSYKNYFDSSATYAGSNIKKSIVIIF